LVLCKLLLLQPGFAGQGSAQPGIRVMVVRGERAKNVIQQIPPEALAVRVEDSGHRPLSGANVTFTAPVTGPSGQFASGTNTVNLTTNPEKLATAEEYHPNATPGSYQIQVRAEYQNQLANALIDQTNMETGKSHAKLIITMLAIATATGAT